MSGQDERNWDGNWSMDGLNGMFAKLNETTFIEDQLKDFEADKAKSLSSGGALRMDQEFLNLEDVANQTETGELQKSWAMLQSQLHSRNLQLELRKPDYAQVIRSP